jgi:hypothetical protein
MPGNPDKGFAAGNGGEWDSEMATSSTMRRAAWLAIAGAGLFVTGGALAQTATSPANDAAADVHAYDPAEQPDFSVLSEPLPDVRPRGARMDSRAPSGPDTIGSRSEKADGSISVSAGRRLPIDWDTKVGVDVAAPAPLPDAFAGQAQDRGSGWANVAVPARQLGLDKATIDARVDPNADQGRLSTALSRSVPIGDGMSVTLQNGYAVTQSLANPGGVTSATHVFSGDGAVRVELPTATALSAGARMSSSDERLLPSVSAEQKLFDSPLSVTGSISQRPTGETYRSIMAGFKKSW